MKKVMFALVAGAVALTSFGAMATTETKTVTTTDGTATEGTTTETVVDTAAKDTKASKK